MKTFILICCLLCQAALAEVQLANQYHQGVDLSQYWVSEKLDGIRGVWTGRKLLSKAGKPLTAPAWFTQALPPVPLDGELWTGRSAFAEVAAIVLDDEPDDNAWHKVHYLIFDMPGEPGPFDERLKAMNKLIPAQKLPWLEVITQFKVKDQADLMARLEAVLAKGGEGLMLHKGSAAYHGGRDDDLLKLKPYQDMEGTVIAVLPGKGKYQGMMGSLVLKLDNGVEFRLGTGFSDAERRQPPAPGTRVTFQYNGLTQSGKPRFARFLRVRPTGS
ncbi:DNA ligase [Gallaecimonas kandeliae]|uniref:DNA ligase n=1 Tax=Gallaecimonas kandeliae TaxID=3029055 RepID=UPI002649E8DA|nr:DNA ligase [Gallaecimonas kandeliae]WKE64088.1 DNA ligase [Gallaecimonas kandeliae]